jgi:hypothetical protein
MAMLIDRHLPVDSWREIEKRARAIAAEALSGYDR